MKKIKYLGIAMFFLFSSVGFSQQNNSNFEMYCGILKDQNGLAPSERTNPVLVIKDNKRFVQSSQNLSTGINTEELRFVKSGSGYDQFDTYETNKFVVKFAIPWITSYRQYRLAWISIKGTGYVAQCLVGGAVQ
ncbi:MAG: hypothetical protein J0M15_09355 [Deltaproteobacteria bacterium]|nr:hypothetical protein [Deltaproteobacteria bacterium]